MNAPFDDDHPRVADILPVLSVALQRHLREAGETDLAIVAADLRVYGNCECDGPTCHSFYTDEPPNGPYGEGHRNILLDREDGREGMIILDVVRGRIKFVEVLD
ncbi:hypothetical protein [Glycomyces buryatensis]|uniref:hypothetical protein n=1 Tax=Glycomyces buryatensis TaxID=2570927 RepID=UPI001B3C1690|nr:hypothetical protein [Glycomyces buryatensis]